ncbi:helix-turn-helix domain-containing protein [Actinomadura rubrisoli]|uniref:XRE family transcriptional regulator n=1 Tax=Actinomadura rubrisoli TaxID=2530368 RepID=A0A4R5CJL7_9ACTN|nr:helix-turn-helix transcriptional regulator [Actinomadura rubrisoli]TDD97584.1 XRE family transcriptional regulator [Actinomadura rubrisoli]
MTSCPHPLIQQLTAERIRRGLSQRTAATRAGVSASTVCMWETGSSPSLTLLEIYAESLGFHLNLVAVAHATPGEATP